MTDIVILVVAADEGLKPQTIEAIHHAKAANCPILVAINKIDKPDANLDNCKSQLADHGLLAEDWADRSSWCLYPQKPEKVFRNCWI